MPAAGFDVYVLVHPETYPASNEPRVIHPVFRGAGEDNGWVQPEDYGWHDAHGNVLDLLSGFDARLAALTATHARALPRRILINDGAITEFAYDADSGEWYEDMPPGVPGDGWDTVPAQPHELTSKVPGLLPAGTRVLLAGFSRVDCVAEVAKILKADGCRVTVDEPVTLPLTEAALTRWVSGSLD